jgi:hypothetical protein
VNVDVYVITAADAFIGLLGHRNVDVNVYVDVDVDVDESDPR